MGYRSGKVSYDGNGMVGGHWWACDLYGKVEININDILDRLSAVSDCVPEEFSVEAKFEAGEDTSVGLAPYCEIQEEGVVPDYVIEAIDSAKISDSWKAAMKAVLDAYVEELKPEDYVLDD